MQTTITRNGAVLSAPAYTLLDWARQRVNTLAEEDATAPFLRGYLDYSGGREENAELFIGRPLEADDYYSGRQLASYEIGPLGEELVA
jgi:hypothetical protein